jgi:TonB-linked SusC/RagA family outer membrane protein
MKQRYKRNDLRRFCLFITLLFAFFTINSEAGYGQSLAITGRVTSAEDSLPLIGVSVREKGTSNGAVTDLDGKFKMSAAADAVLSFSYSGFENLEIPVGGKAVFNVSIRPKTQILQDVVITGYKKEFRSDVASAISTIKTKDIERLVVTGIDQALQGQASGVQVTQSTGAPGDDIVVRIRGAGTLGNNNPLFVIDGVPTTGNINMFSTNDIESIEVLKDGAAAAIYGARAANGVVLITTKKGKSGKTSFSFNTSAGFSEPYKLPTLLNSAQYLSVRNQAIKNANTLRDLPHQLDTIDVGILSTLPNVNWLKEVFKPAPVQRYSLSATGGGENSRYFISADYLDDEGIFRGQSFKKYGLRFNGETGTKRFRVGNNISIAYTERTGINSSGDGFGPGNQLNGVRYALIAAPVFPIRHADGTYVNTSTELGNPTLFGDGNANPLALIDATDWTTKRYRIFGNVYAELSLFDGLKLRTTLGGDLLFENQKIFKLRLSPAIYSPTSLTESRVIDQNLVWNNTIDFQRTFGRHRISALAGMEAIQDETNYLGASGNNFSRTDPLFHYIDNSVPTDIQNIGASGIVTQWALLSYFAQAGYTFDNRFVLGASVRRDGSSRFGSNYRYGIFPSVSGAWNVSNEKFFEHIKFVSALKLRGSWGRLGNQEIGVYPFSSLVQTGIRGYSFGGQVVTGAQVVETGNQNIRWESTTQTDAGMDVSFWKDRLTISFDVYRKLTDGILVRVPVPEAGGSQNPPYVNAGQVENKGIELSVIYKNRIADFNYSIGGNISTVRNKVLSIADGEPILGGFGLSDGPITKTEPGYSVGSFYLWKMVGIFQNQAEIDNSPFQSTGTRPGDVKFADLNGDGKIDDKDRGHFGNPFPKFIYALNASVAWKNFDLSVLAQGVQGNDVYFLYGGFAYEAQARGFNSYADILNAWTPTNTNTNIPKVSIDDRNGNRRISTRFLQDGSYLRIRNITLGYNFKSLIKTKAITNLRFYVSAQNAFTFTKYKGLDPEIQANTNDTRGSGLPSDLAVGIDWGTVPAPRTFIAGFTLEF